jgi:hypothetical protein
VLRVGRVTVAGLLAAAAGITVAVASAAYGEPNHVQVVVTGCDARVQATDFAADVDTVEWDIYRGGASAAIRSGEFAINANGAGTSTISPVLGRGQYRLTWSYRWRGQSVREGTAFFTVPSCAGGSSPPQATPTPARSTSPATGSATPKESSTPLAAAVSTRSPTPRRSEGADTGAATRPAQTSTDSRPPAAVIGLLAVFALASGGTAAYIASRRTPAEPRRHRNVKAGPPPESQRVVWTRAVTRS